VLDHLHAPYLLLGTSAVITWPDGTVQPVRAIDETRGAPAAGPDIDYATVVPAANVRMSEVPSKPTGGTLSMAGRLWSIKSSAAIIGPEGYGTGEWQLQLQEKTP